MRGNQSNRFGRHPMLFGISAILLATLLCGSVYAQPANDDCGTAAVLPGSAPFPPYTVSVDATDATLDPADPLLSCNAAGDDDGSQTVWYVYTPDAGGWVDFNTLGSTEAGGSELDTAHGAFTGSCGDLVQVACVDQGLNDNLDVEVEAGTTYYIKVGQFQGGNDAGTVVMNVDEGVPPIEPARLIIESSRNGTSAPVGDIVAGLAPDTLAAARSGNALDVLGEIPNFMQADGQASKSDAENVGSQVAGNGQCQMERPGRSSASFRRRGK